MARYDDSMTQGGELTVEESGVPSSRVTKRTTEGLRRGWAYYGCWHCGPREDRKVHHEENIGCIDSTKFLEWERPARHMLLAENMR